MDKRTLIQHYKNGYGITRPPAITDDYIHDCAYVIGELSPRFPVPVIQVKCFFHPEYINVVKYNGKQGVYGPGYETIYEWVHENARWRWTS